jgi:hypothetical protein
VLVTRKYKIVVVGSGAVVTGMRKQRIDVGDYGAVMKFLGL